MQRILTSADFDLNVIDAMIYAIADANAPAMHNEEQKRFQRGPLERTYEVAD
jgi:hypothetical protein